MEGRAEERREYLPGAVWREGPGRDVSTYPGECGGKGPERDVSTYPGECGGRGQGET